MIVSIHQPEHLPWPGLISKASKSEIFVILDSVAFRKNYFQNRNAIHSQTGRKWLTIPVQTKLDKRSPGQSSITTQRKESDKVKFLSGIFDGKTIGTSIGFIIDNTDIF